MLDDDDNIVVIYRGGKRRIIENWKTKKCISTLIYVGGVIKLIEDVTRQPEGEDIRRIAQNERVRPLEGPRAAGWSLSEMADADFPQTAAGVLSYRSVRAVIRI